MRENREMKVTRNECLVQTTFVTHSLGHSFREGVPNPTDL